MSCQIGCRPGKKRRSQEWLQHFGLNKWKDGRDGEVLRWGRPEGQEFSFIICVWVLLFSIQGEIVIYESGSWGVFCGKYEPYFIKSKMSLTWRPPLFYVLLRIKMLPVKHPNFRDIKRYIVESMGYSQFGSFQYTDGFKGGKSWQHHQGSDRGPRENVEVEGLSSRTAEFQAGKLMAQFPPNAKLGS